MLTPKEVFLNFSDYENLINQSKNKIKEDKITILETINGTKIAARHNRFDAKIIREQFVDLQYFPDDVYINNFKPKVVLDIGGYIGDVSLYCASKFGSKIHCYEPTPQNFTMIQKNLLLNPTYNITVFNKGISGSSEIINLNIQDMLGEIHASSNKTYDTDVISIEIPCISLTEAIENLNEPVVDLLKIDCEGQEFEILGNCDTEYLSKKVKYLVFEHHRFVENYEIKIEKLLKKLKNNFSIIKNTKNLFFLETRKK